MIIASFAVIYKGRFVLYYGEMAKIYAPESVKQLPTAIITHMIALSTSGFGLVAALAWNEVIKTFVEEYIKPYLGNGSGIISLLIYAIIVTLLAVFVTLQLTFLQKKLIKEQTPEK